MNIYYFTRTGRSETVAKEIASAHGVTAHKIEDNEDWTGTAKYIKAGYMSAKKKIINIQYEDIKNDDSIVLVFPIWAGGFPPAVLTFISKVGKERIIAVPTSFVSKLKDRDGFINVYDLIGKEISTPTELLAK